MGAFPFLSLQQSCDRWFDFRVLSHPRTTVYEVAVVGAGLSLYQNEPHYRGIRMFAQGKVAVILFNGKCPVIVPNGMPVFLCAPFPSFIGVAAVCPASKFGVYIIIQT